MNHGLLSMRQLALTKMYIDQYYDQPYHLNLRNKEIPTGMQHNQARKQGGRSHP